MGVYLLILVCKQEFFIASYLAQLQKCFSLQKAGINLLQVFFLGKITVTLEAPLFLC